MSVKIKAIERSRKLSMAILAIFVGCFWITWALSTVNSTPISAATTANGSASATADVVVNLTSAISIRTLDSTASSEIESLNLELTPTPSGRFTKDTTVVDVSTSNPSGYKLYMQSDYTDSSSSTPSTPVYTTDMLHSNPSVSDKVANLGSTNVTEVAFSAANSSYRNSWGYSLNGLSIAGVVTYMVFGILSKPNYKRMAARSTLLVPFIISRLVLAVIIIAVITYAFIGA